MQLSGKERASWWDKLTPKWKKLMQINYVFNFRDSDAMRKKYINPGINPFDNYKNKLGIEFLPFDLEQTKVDKLFQCAFFYAADCAITDIEPIKYLTNLKVLDLSYNALTNYEQLAMHRKLEVLYLEKSGISSLVFLQDLIKMQELFLRNNSITSLKGIEGLKELLFLDLGLNDIEDISHLARLFSLEQLQLDNNLLKTVSGLQDLPLKVLALSNNRIDDTNFIYKMKQLNYLNLKGNSISSEQLDKNQINPDMEIVLE